MDALAPMLMNFLEQQARPVVQSKVTEQLNSTKGDLKNSLPNTIMSYLTGSDGSGGGNAMISELVKSLGPNFMSKVSSVTGSTVDTASEGMDALLTNGVMNIAKSVLTSNAGGTQSEGAGGINFDFLTAGKEGMVNQTMAASAPVIKQVSGNMSNKLSSSIPATIAGAIQQMVDKNGGAADGALGMAAGLMSKLMAGGGPGNGGGNQANAQASGGSTGGIQQILQNLLGPKILLLIQPYMQKFEAQMSSALENELRNKVFSSDYIKQALTGMLSGGNGQGGGASALLGGVMNTFMNGGGQGGQQGGNGQNAALGAMANMAGEFLKNRG